MEDDEASTGRTLSGRLKFGGWPEQLAPIMICSLCGTWFECYNLDQAAGSLPHAAGDVVDAQIATTRLERTLMRCDVELLFESRPEVKLWLPRDSDDSRGDRSRWLAAVERLRAPEAPPVDVDRPYPPPPPPVDDAAAAGETTEDRRRSIATTLAYAREIFIELCLKGSIEVDRAVSAHTYGVSCEVDADGGDPGFLDNFPSAARVDAPTRHMVRTLVDKLLAEAEDAPAWATISRGYEFEFAPLWGSLVRTGHSIRLSASCASLQAARARGITELPSTVY